MSDDRTMKMRSIRNDFSSRKDAYDQEIARCVPNYRRMLESAIDSLPFESDDLHIIDLGTGTGALAELVLQRYPGCHLTCVDMTSDMLDKARERLDPASDVQFVLKDFYELELPGNTDAVVSSLALHHLITDDDKRCFYARVLECLRPGGVFVNADAVLGSDEWLEQLYKQKWKEFMRQTMSETDVQTIMDRHRREDSLPMLMDQLEWLREAGFSKVDVIWKDHMGAVVWARK